MSCLAIRGVHIIRIEYALGAAKGSVFREKKSCILTKNGERHKVVSFSVYFYSYACLFLELIEEKGLVCETDL